MWVQRRCGSRRRLELHFENGRIRRMTKMYHLPYSYLPGRVPLSKRAFPAFLTITYLQFMIAPLVVTVLVYARTEI
jgi:hypothetical protein